MDFIRLDGFEQLCQGHLVLPCVRLEGDPVCAEIYPYVRGTLTDAQQLVERCLNLHKFGLQLFRVSMESLEVDLVLTVKLLCHFQIPDLQLQQEFQGFQATQKGLHFGALSEFLELLTRQVSEIRLYALSCLLNL